MGRVATVLSSHFTTLGDQLMPDLSTAFGNTDPEAINAAKIHIDEAVTTGLQEMQRVIEQEFTKMDEA